MATETVKVAVPKGKRPVRTMGVFLNELGVINVDVPYGLKFGDEFELTVDKTQHKGTFTSKVSRVPLPYGLTPGMVFKHRTPNGKNISVSCPPGITEDDVLLVPWSESTTEHFIVQAQVAPPEPKKNHNKNNNKTHTTAHQQRSTQNGRINPQYYVDDDFRLAQALSVTTLSSPNHEEEEMQRVMKASLEDAARQQQLLLLAQFIDENLVLEHTLKLQEPSNEDLSSEDLELEKAVKASLEESTPKHMNAGADDDDEEAILKRVTELSLNEAYKTARASAMLYNQDCDYINNDNHSFTSSNDRYRDEGPDNDNEQMVETEPHAVIKGNEDRIRFLNSLPDEVRKEVLRQEAIQEQAMRVASLEQQQY
jgi:hypothetical protein